MVPMRDSRIVEASHEPQKVAQASCLFGADRLEACPTLQPAPRFMAATHVQSLEVFAFHEPGGSARIPCVPVATASLPPGRTAGKDARRTGRQDARATCLGLHGPNA